MSQPQAINPRHPLSVVFLLHIFLEAPVAVQGWWSPMSMPFLGLNNTTLVVLKLYSVMSLATCLAALLCNGLPEFMAGKRALGLALGLYHTTLSTILFQAPRIIPHTFGPLAESYKLTPEVAWGIGHGVVGLGFAIWWQLTVGYMAMIAGNASR
ncbi:hypothetical protein K488DRAFT_48993 [Vararia minispora EC-137]|uniref:Uncharacterized protein n=1 Tax=Vararia minispora EC-137 TaxID=1314806 RepID=A0ACB8QMH7_9AGAM|nr:hypothetical protein K488DRAFT_48993 [Vararia minispora EC-137]